MRSLRSRRVCGYPLCAGGWRFGLFDGAIEPKVYVDDTQQFGFNAYAEKLNGRLAMIGFVSALAFEALTGQGIVTWLTHL